MCRPSTCRPSTCRPRRICLPVRVLPHVRRVRGLRRPIAASIHDSATGAQPNATIRRPGRGRVLGAGAREFVRRRQRRARTAALTVEGGRRDQAPTHDHLSHHHEPRRRHPRPHRAAQTDSELTWIYAAGRQARQDIYLHQQPGGRKLRLAGPAVGIYVLSTLHGNGVFTGCEIFLRSCVMNTVEARHYL